jgi:hypothetical protein
MIAKAVLRRLWRRGLATEVPTPVSQDTTLLGHAAKRLLDDPVLALAFDLLEDEYVERWRGSALGDTAQREELYRLYFALLAVRARLRLLLDDANLLAAEEARRKENPELWAA